MLFKFDQSHHIPLPPSSPTFTKQEFLFEIHYVPSQKKPTYKSSQILSQANNRRAPHEIFLL